ncbi:MAG TPA: hypothetical protein VIJ75_23740 [Hanamia sp.]
MKHALKTGFIGGSIGAVVLAVIAYIMQLTNNTVPPFVAMYSATIGAHPGYQVVAFILFIISGGIWGLIFTWIVKRPTVLKGILFGLLPNLWIWLVIDSYFGRPLFNGFTLMGIVGPIVSNMLIWGGILGWYASRKLKTSAV